MADIIHTTEVAPAGYHLTNAGVLPNEWTSSPLSSIVEEITETAGTRKIETVSISAGIGFVNQAEKFGKELSGKQYEKYTVLHQGDFSYNKGNSNLYPQGCIYRLNDRTEAAVPNVFESFRVVDGDPNYYEQLFTSGFLNKQLYSRINRGVRDDGLLNLRGEDFYCCEVPCPPLAEQERIAEILMQCDKVIELKEKKNNEIKQLKKECLKKMFPQKGQTGPEFRFPEFSGAWEQCKFGDLADYKKGPFGSAITKNMFVPKSEDSIKVYEQQNAINKDWSLERYFLPKEYVHAKLKSFEVHDGDLIVSCAGTIGEIYEIPENAELGVINQALMRIRVNEDIVDKKMFIITFSNMIDSFAKIHSNGSAIKNIPPFADLKPTEVLVPSMAEQRKISRYFDELDNLIALYQRELEEQKAQKKVLEQLLLTGIVRTRV